MKLSYYLFLFLFILLNQIFGIDENTALKKINAVRTNENIKIDGNLSEKIWQRPGDTNLTQQEPVQGVKPSQHSEYWFAYDDAAIYFAVRYLDNKPDSIMARLVRRDYIWGDPSDGCVLYLDPYNDDRNGYFFYVSAAGTLADGLIENDVKQPNDLTWDAVWEGSANINSEGWCVEMKIPFSQLRYKDSEKQVWGVDVERFISRAAETDMVAYTPRNENGFVSRFPDLVGIEGIKPSAHFELLPYITGKGEYIGNDSKDPFNPGHKYLPGAGLDVKAGLGSSIILNGTINPDFGQVEVDPAVVNLSDVETSFDEKRPFFTEGVTIFRFGRGGTNNNVSFSWANPNIFYSRRIGRTPQGSLPDYTYADIPNGTHILGAGKITGQIDNWKIGMIHALTERESAEIESDGNRSKIEIEPLTYYGIIRAQRDFDAGQRGIGILSTFTNRFFKDENLRNSVNKDAVVAAADGYSFLDNDRTYVLTGWAALSNVMGNREKMIALQRSSWHYFQRPDVSYIKVDSSATSLTGYSGRIILNKNRGSFIFNTALGFISPKFEVNDLGYSTYSDIINTHFYAGYRWNTPTEYYQSMGISAAVYSNYDFGGNNIAQGYYLQSYINFSNLYGGNFTCIYNPSTYNARRTRGGPLTLNPSGTMYDLYLYTDNRLWWVFTIDGNINTAGGIDSKSITTTFEFKVSPTLTLSIEPYIAKDIYQAQWISAFTDPIATETYGKRYVFAHLDQTTLSTDIRVDWILSPTLSVQAYIQPLIASGKYSEFKALRRPKTFDFMNYGEDGSTLEKNVSEDGGISYTLDPDGQGTASPKTISNPDFNFISLRGNAVLRWEYMPGSALFLVWTQSREGIESNGDFRFGRSMDNLINVKPDNIFMLKLTYWLGM